MPRSSAGQERATVPVRRDHRHRPNLRASHRRSRVTASPRGSIYNALILLRFMQRSSMVVRATLASARRFHKKCSFATKQTPRQPNSVNAGECEREAKPRNGILQVVVGQSYFEFSRFWPATGRHGRFLVNEKRRNRSPFLSDGDRIGIAQIPNVASWIIIGRECTALFGPSKDTDNVQGALRCTFRTRSRILSVDRNKPSVDDDDAASGKPRRRKHPVTRALHIWTQRRTGRVDQGFLALNELCRKFYSAELLIVLAQRRPIRARRQITGRARKPRIQ